MNYWQSRQERFHALNPGVYHLFKRFTLEAIAKGRDHFSAGLVLGRIRWYSAIETTGEPWKINENFAAYYARQFMRDFPEHAGFFRTRILTGELPPRRLDARIVDTRNYGGLGQHSIG